MSMTESEVFAQAQAQSVSADHGEGGDMLLIWSTLLLLGLGLVMVTSSSIDIADKRLEQPFYYLLRQLAFLGLGVSAAWLVLHMELDVWRRMGPSLLLFGFFLLALVLILGREVNGSVRWLSIGPFNLQVSELFKLFMVIYLADYLQRRLTEVRETAQGFLKPMAVVTLATVLLLMEPDFGAAAVLVATVMGMLFLAGVQLRLFLLLLLIAALALALMVLVAPYRMARLTAFLNPWADPFNSGFQLTQALIAFGRGEWWGVGLGGSIQKLFYLPEAHTDFLFAVLAEELGLLGALVTLALFATVVWRVFCIARRAERSGQLFAAFLSYGIGLWFSLQVIVNIGVNMGVLPTKGLTLPLMSYGGSSMVMMCIALAIVLRVDRELRQPKRPSHQSKGRYVQGRESW